MADYHMRCNYCGKKWSQKILYQEALKKVSCSTCQDKNVKITKPETGNVFGYDETPKADTSYYDDDDSNYNFVRRGN